jgi:hypothetical protein
VSGPDDGTSHPVPIRILIKGASEVVLLAEPGGPRTDFNFGRVIEAGLLASGRPAQVHVDAVPSAAARLDLHTWQQGAIAWSPDVVVLHYGHYESIHFFLPRWLERHANSWRWRPTRLNRMYRKRVLRPLWVSLAQLQKRVDHRFDSLAFRRRLQRVAVDVGAQIEHLRELGAPLVLVLEVVPPGAIWREWFPGLDERTAFMNAQLEQMVQRFDSPDVRFVRTTPELAARLDPGEEATPDGGHYSARSHRIVGEVLTREIVTWAQRQPHLAV